jgi:hypothetical protein
MWFLKFSWILVTFTYLLLQCKAWDVLVNGAIGERRYNFGKVGQWGGPVQHCPQNWRVGWPHWPTGKMVDGGEQYQHHGLLGWGSPSVNVSRAVKFYHLLGHTLEWIAERRGDVVALRWVFSCQLVAILSFQLWQVQPATVAWLVYREHRTVLNCCPMNCVYIGTSGPTYNWYRES